MYLRFLNRGCARVMPRLRDRRDFPFGRMVKDCRVARVSVSDGELDASGKQVVSSRAVNLRWMGPVEYRRGKHVVAAPQQQRRQADANPASLSFHSQKAVH